MSDDFFNELDDLAQEVPESGTGDGSGIEEEGLRKLAALVESLNAELSTSTILDRAMKAAIELAGAERGFLVLLSDDGNWSFRVARNMETGDIADAETAASQTVIRRVLEGRQPILINDVVGGSDLTRHQSIAKMQVRSVMGAPLISKGKLLGAAYVDTTRLAGVFDHSSLALFESFVQLAAIAIENARLIEAEQQATARYRELQEYLNSVLSSQPHGVLILDPGLRIEYSSPQAALLFDHGPLRPGISFADSNCCDKEIALQILSGLDQFVRTEANPRLTLELPTRILACSFFRVQPSREGYERVGIILEDITAQKQLERKLVESERQSTINQLAGGIAHEINNSLQPVKGRVELLAMRLKMAGVPIENGIDKDLETISALSGRIEKIARNLTHLTKPARPEFKPLDIHDLIQSTVDLMETTTGTLKNFSREDPSARFWINLDLDDGLPPVMGNAHSLESALINMILNSSHAVREKGKGMLTLRARAVNGEVELIVEDTGTGIHPDVQARIFEPYFTTRGGQGGTGLGMSIIQNVAEIHGAKLELSTKWGEGTRITIRFPAAGVFAGITP